MCTLTAVSGLVTSIRMAMDENAQMFDEISSAFELRPIGYIAVDALTAAPLAGDMIIEAVTGAKWLVDVATIETGLYRIILRAE